MIIIQRILLFLKRRGIKVLKNALINNLRKKQFSVRDTLDTSAKELLSGVSVKNPPYPPIHRVVKDRTTSEDTGQREGNNPCYPSIHQAVSDQRAPDTDEYRYEQSTVSSNSSIGQRSTCTKGHGMITPQGGFPLWWRRKESILSFYSPGS